jgi:cytochrome c553
MNPIKHTLILTSLLLIASSAAEVRAEGNAETGRLLAYTCMGCHGIEGYRNA